MATNLQQRLTRLKDFILRYNTYFNHGFDSVSMHENGYVANGDKVIFPADDMGNFFYLRLPNHLQADYNNFYTIADNAMSIGVKYDVILVACAVEADNILLLENMITTLGKYQEEPLKITKMIYKDDDVVAQELARIKKENINDAIQRFPDNMSICSVHFTFTIPFVFQSLNCIQNPCKTC